jgi:hypothetical protein
MLWMHIFRLHGAVVLPGSSHGWPRRPRLQGGVCCSRESTNLFSECTWQIFGMLAAPLRLQNGIPEARKFTKKCSLGSPGEHSRWACHGML